MNAYIKGISCYLPERIVSNEELVREFPEWNVEKIAAKVGIRERHIAATDETAGDMAEKAARKLFEEHGIEPGQIDFILLCTQSPDYFLPTTACLLQQRLGLRTDTGALDFNLGCSGYVYGLALAQGLIAGGTASHVLLLTSETYNKYIHRQDKGNRSLFGDGATATLISTEGRAAIGRFVPGTDGSGADNLMVGTGASRCPQRKNDARKDETGTLRSSDHLYMNGTEIFNFTLETVPALVKKVLDRNGIAEEAVSRYVFHQANRFMLETLRKVCRLPKEKFHIDLEHTGNCVSSSIPIALHQLWNGLQGPVLTAGFGVGYSWGGCILTFNPSID